MIWVSRHIYKAFTKRFVLAVRNFANFNLAKDETTVDSRDVIIRIPFWDIQVEVPIIYQ